MLRVKLMWPFVVLIIAQGCCCFNSTKKAAETSTTSQKPSLNQTTLELLKIFHGEPNTTTTERSFNDTFTNTTTVAATTEQSLNNTYTNTTLPYDPQLWNSTNSTITGAVASSSDDVLPFRLPNWAAIAAGVCLVSGVIGYISCVSYRRFLQRKYGNSEILVGEDVYDTSDLRNFEI